MIGRVIVFALMLGACAPHPASLADVEALHDWANEPAETLNRAWSKGAASLLANRPRPEAIEAITKAGFTCVFGEAHETYPDPMAVCTKSFATRACQMDWEIASTAHEGRIDQVIAAFNRDCVGTDRDWPDAKRSPIDEHLSPPAPLGAPS